MSSIVSICNQALSHCGQDEIVSIENSYQNLAVQCRIHYDECRRKLLASSTWNFAKKRVSLPALTEKPAWGYKNQFQKPADYIQIIREENRNTEYMVESGLILCDNDIFNMLYVYDNKDTLSYPPEYVECLAYYLASKICFPLTANEGRAGALEQRFVQELSIARSSDAVEASDHGVRNETLFQDLVL